VIWARMRRIRFVLRKYRLPNLPMRGSALFAPYYLLRNFRFRIKLCGNYANW
jgi:hypothetical protein